MEDATEVEAAGGGGGTTPRPRTDAYVELEARA
jgi:hypothetical protein